LPVAKAVHWGAGPRLALGVLLAALGAALFVLAFPPYRLWPLAFVWVVPVMISVHRVMPSRLSGLAMGLGVGGFFWRYFQGLFPGLPLMQWLPLLIGAVAALIAARDRAFHARTNYRWFVLHGAVVWVGIEMVRGVIPVVGTWGFAAYTLYGQPWLIQPVSHFSIYGMSLVILLANFAIALWALALVDRRWRFEEAPGPIDQGRALRHLAVTSGVLAGWAALSLALYRAPEGDLMVAAIQPGTHIAPGASEESVTRGLELMSTLTREATEAGARFVVWPEGFLPFDPQEQETTFFVDLATGSGAYLVLGYGVRTEAGLRNEAAILSPGGDFLGVFGKDHPVVFAGETSLTRGTYPAFESSIGRLGAIICYDLDFTDTTRKVARNGAQLVGVPSFDWPAIAHKHYSHVVFRAVENRVSMVKADVAFDSAIIDPWGNIIRRFVSVEPSQAVLVGPVPLGRPWTLSLVVGDWVGWLCMAGMVAFLGIDLRTASRARRN